MSLIDIANLAATYELHVTLGFLEKSGDQLFNAAALIGPSGVVGCYRKAHLPTLGVDRFVDRGNIPYQSLQASDARVGLAICYDSSFPEPMRVLALGSTGLPGAHVIDRFEDRCPDFYGSVAATKPTAATHHTGRTTPGGQTPPPANPG